MSGAVSSTPATPPIDAVAAREVRAHLRARLDLADLDPEDVERLVLAAWEALVNVAEHGGGRPQLVIAADRDGGSVTILDPAASRPPLVSPVAPSCERGRGTQVIAASVGRRVLCRTPHGTSLHLAVDP